MKELPKLKDLTKYTMTVGSGKKAYDVEVYYAKDVEKLHNTRLKCWVGLHKQLPSHGVRGKIVELKEILKK